MTQFNKIVKIYFNKWSFPNILFLNFLIEFHGFIVKYGYRFINTIYPGSIWSFKCLLK